MKTCQWGMQAGFPHSKVFILGIWLTLLGSACVVISVLGIVQMAWGYYVSTGMWGGVAITVTGLATMYAARAQTSLSAKMYFAISVLDIPVSFAMLVLSAGGLTYKSNFYAPVRFNSDKHQVTLLLHGSVLSASVLSLACNVLSVIVCLKFISFEKNRRSDSFKLRKRRHRFSDPNGVYRTGSQRDGSGGGTARSSTSSRAPLVSSDRSQRHSRQSSYSDNGSLRSSADRTPLRRDSDRSRGSSRSRPSHHRQSSSVSQQSRYESLHSRQSSQHGGSDSVYSTLTRENHRSQHGASYGANGVGESSLLHPSHAARVLLDGGGDRLTVQPVFDSDEEPVPPYAESETNTGFSSNTGDESDIENSDHTALDDSSSTLLGVSHLPLNIPVTEVGTPNSRGRPDSLQLGRTASGYSGSASSDRGNSGTNRSNVNIVGEHDNRRNISHMAAVRLGTSPRSHYNFSQPPQSHAQHVAARETASRLSQNRGSPEICALTGERETPSTLRGSPSPHESSSGLESSSLPSSGTPRTLTERGGSQVPHLNHSSDSSDTSLTEREGVGSRDATLPGGSRPSAVDTHSVVSLPGRRGGEAADEFNSPADPGSAVSSPQTPRSGSGPLSLGSPNSAFRPVGRTVPVSQISSSAPAPSSALFSPISAHGGAHSSNLESSTESLSRSSVLSWKMIPLPTSHNHSNRASSVPTKELTTKDIPAPEFHSPRVYGRTTDPHALVGRNVQSVTSNPADVKSSVVRSPQIRTHDAASDIQGASNAVLDSSPQFSSLPLRSAPGLDRQRSGGTSSQQSSAGNELSRRQNQGGDQGQRHIVELPSSVRGQPSVAGSSASERNSRLRAERQRCERRAEREPLSLHSVGQSRSQSVSVVSPVQPSSSRQYSAHSQPPQQPPPSRQQQEQSQSHRQQQLQPHQHPLPPPPDHQQQQQQQPPQPAPGQQPQQPHQQPQQPPQPAQQQNRPLFSVLL